MKEILGDLFEGGIKKIFAYIITPFLPIFAILGMVHITGNYWWDLLICFGFSGIIITLIVISIRRK